MAPAALAKRIDALAAGFNGRVGIAVQSVDTGWRTGWRAEDLYPQQSVSKMWVALTAMDAVDKGRVQLTDPVTITSGKLGSAGFTPPELVTSVCGAEATGRVFVTGKVDGVLQLLDPARERTR